MVPLFFSSLKDVKVRGDSSNEAKAKDNSTHEGKKGTGNYTDHLKRKFHLPVESEDPVKTQQGVEQRFNAESAFEQCMSLIEKEFREKTDEESKKLREEMEKLCFEKKKEDVRTEEEEGKRQKEKEKKETSATEENYEEKKRKEIISKLGLSSKTDIPLRILEDSLAEIKNCSRNYREHCPLNWKFDSDKITCIAPDSYIGSCEKRMSSAIDITEKKKKEKECSFFWRCENNCVQDMENFICPLYWEQIDDVTCQAPSNYTGKCLNTMKFGSMGNKEKVIYSNLCDVMWPCKEKCEHDYSVLCPEGWLEKEKEYCVASNLYKGNCDKILHLKNFDKSMKEIYEDKCNFSYPCVNTTCEKNYDDMCPNLWIPVNDNECAPSEFYNGNCKENYIFKKKNIEEKKQFEKLCNVSYSCLQTCQRDYSSNCPIGWKETLVYCLAPSTYKYDCRKTMRKNLKDVEKIQISKKCHVFWPCSNYEVLLKHLLHENMSEQDYISILNGPIDAITGEVISA